MFFHWALLALIFFPSLFHVNIQLPLRLVMVNRTNGASTRKSRCPFLSFPYKNGGIME